MTGSRSSTRSITCWPTASRRPTRWRRRWSRTSRPDGLARSRRRTRSVRGASLLKAAGRDHVGLIRKLPRLVNETATGVSRVRRRAKERGHHPDLARNFAPPQCFINHVVSPGRRFATAPLSLADVKETGKHLGVTLNDIVLAMAAGALRKLLLRYDGSADSPLIAGVPVSYQHFTGTVGGQRIHLHDSVVACTRRRPDWSGSS